MKKKITLFLRRCFIYFICHTSSFWSSRIYILLRYYFETGIKLNLENPRTFFEKLQWLKLYNRRPEYSQMVDKYSVKQYVAKKIGSEYIIPTLGVWNLVDDIDWNVLPNQFVLKTTHGGGGGGVIICRDKSKLDKVSVCKKLQRSLNSDIYLNYREWPYKNVPKRIIAEKLMIESSADEEKDLIDYKFYCFNGKPIYCQVIRNRNTNETIDFYDMQWNHMPFVGINSIYDNNAIYTNGISLVSKPVCLNQMIEISKTLSKDIPFARIDLYLIDEKIYFGEITFFPASGIGTFTPIEWNYKLGGMIKLPFEN